MNRFINTCFVGIILCPLFVFGQSDSSFENKIDSFEGIDFPEVAGIPEDPNVITWAENLQMGTPTTFLKGLSSIHDTYAKSEKKFSPLEIIGGSNIGFATNPGLSASKDESMFVSVSAGFKKKYLQSAKSSWEFSLGAESAGYEGGDDNNNFITAEVQAKNIYLASSKNIVSSTVKANALRLNSVTARKTVQVIEEYTRVVNDMTSAGLTGSIETRDTPTPSDLKNNKDATRLSAGPLLRVSIIPKSTAINFSYNLGKTYAKGSNEDLDSRTFRCGVKGIKISEKTTLDTVEFWSEIRRGDNPHSKITGNPTRADDAFGFKIVFLRGITKKMSGRLGIDYASQSSNLAAANYTNFVTTVGIAYKFR